MNAETVTGAAEFHALPVAAAAEQLGVDPARGLSHEEAEARLGRYGDNVVRMPAGPGPIRRFLAQFHNPLIYVLLLAGVVTWVFGGHVDAGVIAGVVLLNAVVGFVQESRAQRALEALSKMVPVETTVVREGVPQRVPAARLVPGDVVELAAGDRVPADVRLAEVHLTEIDESALTGESVPVVKSAEPVPPSAPVADRTGCAYSGTLVTRGQARGLVTATGGATQLGGIQHLVATAQVVETPLTRKLARFSGHLSWVIVAVSAAAFVLGLVRGTPAPEMFTAVVALAVGAIPEGLPAAVAIVLAIGVVRMSRRGAIVRHLPAVETLGGTTVICTDKTGTLTRNRMTVTTLAAAGSPVPVAEAGKTLRECLIAGVLCNDAELEEGDPTEIALLGAAIAAGLDPDAIRVAAPRTDTVPFESETRTMTTVHGEVAYLKGAVEEVAARCEAEVVPGGDVRPLDRDELDRVHGSLTAQGLRVLAFARSTPGAAPVLLGLQAMHDPPRPEAVSSVAACRSAGIDVKMITGDHAGTARAVAGEVGLASGRVLTGAELAALPDAEFDETVAGTQVFARVSPAQKLDLVRALQRRGHVVAMTGDGVNDAPALRRADIGVAMGKGGTDAARQAADMVLTDDDFASIEAAVRVGRGVFDNLRKFIAWTLPANIGEGMVVLVAILLGATLPIVPVQILWINMTTAVFLGLTMAFEPTEHGIMGRPPRPPERPLFTASLLRRVVLVSLLLVVAAFGAYRLQLGSSTSLAEARTTAINVFVGVQAAYLLSCRSLDRPVLRAWPGHSRMFLLGLGLTAGLQLLLTYVPVMNTWFHTAPVGFSSWLWVAGAAVVAFAVVEADKLLWRRYTVKASRGV
ncbi:MULTISPECIES: HAD-IC family P-type ATPase [unclassified Amycolatopsis]|uniref:cation-translocating P-type ATPase n=1 Tax=unclassified Amycolatopsis TaxID=2618356 RepID=UPI00287510F5|nr:MULTISPECIES: HAD-IC family P-type ATPase [unclassified Amycolatopsis]MDS0134694.1 HAD-IC family P-type ATPase [Amycolatopsis sp. 505]MDS0147407.1 HAD-IC family P-type ATPase [Amycolatopsis sp. CM201R]